MQQLAIMICLRQLSYVSSNMVLLAGLRGVGSVPPPEEEQGPLRGVAQGGNDLN